MTDRARPRATPHRRTSGFTLTELAVVVVIVAIMIGGLLLPLATQDELRRTQETQKTLIEVREALIGFAAATGRLPCPASATSNGFEEFCSIAPTGKPPTNCGAPTLAVQAHGQCTHPYDGFVPAATLGLQPANPQGLLIDAWNQPIRYAITGDQLGVSPWTFAFTGADGMRTVTLAALAPDLRVCASATPISGTKCADPETSNVLTKDGVAVIFSVGKNGGDEGDGNPTDDEPVNKGATGMFVYHEPAPKGAVNGEFDDIVIWLSPSILYNRMIAAGRLP